MKKRFAIFFAAILALMLLVGCGTKEAKDPAGSSVQEPTSVPVPESEPAEEPVFFKTMEEVFRYPAEQSGNNDHYYIYVFEKDGVYYRAWAELTDDLSGRIKKLLSRKEDAEKEVHALVAPLAVKKLENLNLMIPTQAELDVLAGKNGKDLLSDGWTVSGYDLSEMRFIMEHGIFTFDVVFDGEVKVDNYEEFDETDAIKPLKVRSVTYTGLGEAADPSASISS